MATNSLAPIYIREKCLVGLLKVVPLLFPHLGPCTQIYIMAAPILQWSDIDYTVNRPRSMLKRIKKTKTEMVTLLDQVSGQLQEGEMLASAYFSSIVLLLSFKFYLLAPLYLLSHGSIWCRQKYFARCPFSKAITHKGRIESQVLE
jgi:hypothetical protein